MGKSKNPTTKAKKPTKRAKAVAAADGEPKPPRKSALNAAEAILRAAGEPMKPADIYAKAKELGLWDPKGRTPVATLAAALFTSVKKAKGRFVKVGKGLWSVA